MNKKEDIFFCLNIKKQGGNLKEHSFHIGECSRVSPIKLGVHFVQNKETKYQQNTFNLYGVQLPNIDR